MPHLVLEYSSNLDPISPLDVFIPCHEILVGVAGAKIEDCKSRAVRLDTFCVGEGNSKAAFAHMKIFLMQGRHIEVRKKVGEKILEILENLFSSKGSVRISVEVLELEKELYFKKELMK